ncbi:hypothetical protein BDW22DRAFT_438078 [Trametopsis cervina]|nr:hypothetical protein BDW22DRAFT_438078 [Trametopsis cervina]
MSDDASMGSGAQRRQALPSHAPRYRYSANKTDLTIFPKEEPRKLYNNCRTESHQNTLPSLEDAMGLSVDTLKDLLTNQMRPLVDIHLDQTLSFRHQDENAFKRYIAEVRGLHM